MRLQDGRLLRARGGADAGVVTDLMALPGVTDQLALISYPIAEAARIAMRTAIEYLEAHTEIRLVRFVLFGPAALRTYERALEEVRPG